jgi:hypothetical protein
VGEICVDSDEDDGGIFLPPPLEDVLRPNTVSDGLSGQRSHCDEAVVTKGDVMCRSGVVMSGNHTEGEKQKEMHFGLGCNSPP